MTTNNAANIAAITGTRIINQVAHGFAIGNVLYLVAGVYTLAIATSLAAAEVMGIVIKSIDADNFIVQYNGVVQGLAGLTAGSTFYLSPSSAGALTITQPVTPTQVIKPLLVADSTTTGYWINLPGVYLS